jgi:hypothetical protein
VPVARFVLRRRARSRRTLACALRVQQLGLRRDPEIKERRIIEVRKSCKTSACFINVKIYN